MVIDPRPSPAHLRSRFPAMVGLSLALHAVALAWVQGPGRPRSPIPTKLDVRLRLPGPAAHPTGGGSAVMPMGPRYAGTEPRRSTAPRRFDPPRPTPAAAPAAPAAAGAAPTAMPAQSEAPREPVPPPPPGVGLPDQASLLARYGSRLSELLARQQEYPRLALMRGWEGEVRLRLRVARRGNLVAVNLDRSSGFDVLDQHALALVQRLSELPPLPEGLETSEIQVVVPIRYTLRKSV